MYKKFRKSLTVSRPEVLVCVLRYHRDKEILFDEKWYRIPLSHAPRRRPKYLAFYQPAIFGKSGMKIELYGRVKYWRIKKRIEILPEDPGHPRSQELYIQFILSRVSKLHRAVTNKRGLRVSFGFTNLYKLRHSPDLRRLFDIPPIEDIMKRNLKKNKISFYSQYLVRRPGKKYFRLDFAIPCPDRWLNIECDGFRWHSKKKQQINDRKRDKKLKSLGWDVLRISEEELVKNIRGVMKKIIDTILTQENSKSETLNSKQ